MISFIRYSDRSDICEDPPWHSGEKYACKARSILFSSIDIPSLSNVQALILLTMHEYSCARGPRYITVTFSLFVIV